MNIQIIAIGKLKEKFWQDAFKEYEKRLKSYCKLTMIELKEAIDDDVVKEGKEILKKILPTDFVIALDVKGVKKSSEALSKYMENLYQIGKSQIVFVIGGSDGLSQDVKDRSDMMISFSDMTFTHQMMRVILAEQIYRSFKIMKNEPYHK